MAKVASFTVAGELTYDEEASQFRIDGYSVEDVLDGLLGKHVHMEIIAIEQREGHGTDPTPDPDFIKRLMGDNGRPD